MKRLLAVLIVAADVVALVALRASAATAVRHLDGLRSWLADAGTDQVVGTLAAAALWCAAAWTAVGLLAGACVDLPGGAGRVAERLAHALLPAVLRRMVAGGAGLGVLLAPVVTAAVPTAAAASGRPHVTTSCAAPTFTATTSTATTSPTGAATAGWVAPLAAGGSSTRAPASEPLPAPIWPGASAPTDAPDVARVPSATPPSATPPDTAPSAPRTTAPRTVAPSTAARPTTAPPTTAPVTASPRATAPPTNAPSSEPPASRPTDRPAIARSSGGAQDVRVRPGDSLWLLGARQLGPHATAAEVAAQWPRIHTANRDVIGDDPDLIVPGQVLHLPAPKEIP